MKNSASNSACTAMNASMHIPDSTRNWYYSSRGTAVGPVSYAQFKEAANSGAIDRFADLAWCDALTDWIPVSSIDGLFAAPPPPGLNRSPHVALGRGYATPGNRKPVSAVLRYVLLAISLCFMFLAIVLMVIAANVGRSSEDGFLIAAAISYGIGLILALVFMVLYLMMIHRAWSIIPEVYRRTTPGKAVGFMFIPLFSLYWMYQAILGLAQDYNKWQASTGGRERMPEGLYLTHCILTSAQVIPFLGLLAVLANIIMFFPIVHRTVAMINRHSGNA